MKREYSRRSQPSFNFPAVNTSYYREGGPGVFAFLIMLVELIADVCIGITATTGNYGLFGDAIKFEGDAGLRFAVTCEARYESNVEILTLYKNEQLSLDILENELTN
jgi:hypothetical protein